MSNSSTNQKTDSSPDGLTSRKPSLVDHEKEELEVAMNSFRKSYPYVNSGDLQTFVIAWKMGFEAGKNLDK